MIKEKDTAHKICHQFAVPKQKVVPFIKAGQQGAEKPKALLKRDALWRLAQKAIKLVDRRVVSRSCCCAGHPAPEEYPVSQSEKKQYSFLHAQSFKPNQHYRCAPQSVVASPGLEVDRPDTDTSRYTKDSLKSSISIDSTLRPSQK